jgi:hypothetical protein
VNRADGISEIKGEAAKGSGERVGKRASSILWITYPWPCTVRLFTSLFQKDIHAVEIDDGMTDVQRIHSQDPADSGATLPQCEIR